MHHARSTVLFPLFLAPLAIAQTTWTSYATPTAPLPVRAHAMGYDVGANLTVLFGGSVSGVRNNQTWLWNGATWTQAAPVVSPPARSAHSMAFDIARNRIVVFGGVGTTGALLGDTWEWDGSTWIATTPTVSPSARRSFPLTYHAASGRVILFGGFSTIDNGDTWSWDGTDWTLVPTTVAPTARRAADMAVDPATGNLILFSGFQQTNDTWSFDGANWTQLAPATSPTARYDHCMVTDLARNRIVLFGGTTVADLWEWDGSTWLSRTPAASPSGRSDAYMAYDWSRRRVFLYGGSGVSDTWGYAPVYPASFATAGTGCVGTNGLPPRAAASGDAWLGETVALAVADTAPAAFPFLVLGFSDTLASGSVPLPLPLDFLGMTGCTLQVDPLALLDAFFGSLPLTIPNDPTLLGAQVFHQPLVLDVGANAADLVTGNHGITTIGGK